MKDPNGSTSVARRADARAATPVRLQVTHWAARVSAGAALLIGLAGAGVRLRGEEPPLRLWGDDQMGALVARWEAGYAREHPGARFENKLMGSDTGMAGLYTGTADVAFLGREINPVEVMAFAWVYRYKPEGIAVVRGSLAAPGRSPALAVIVHRDNPLARLTLAQLDAIFSCAPRRAAAPVESWSQIDPAPGVAALGPIRACAREVSSGTAVFFREHVMRGNRKWAWDHLREFADVRRSDGAVDDADRQIAAAVAADRGAIGISTLRYVDSRVKVLAIGGEDGGSAVLPTESTVTDGRYPLARAVFAYVNRAPGQALDPRVSEFLHYVLGGEGQGDVRTGREFLPLSPTDADNERRRMDRSAP
jgi:phosphate transport system substrate-binding protein